MWGKQCHKPPMTGNGLYIPPIPMLMTGGSFLIVLPTLRQIAAVRIYEARLIIGYIYIYIEL